MRYTRPLLRAMPTAMLMLTLLAALVVAGDLTAVWLLRLPPFKGGADAQDKLDAEAAIARQAQAKRVAYVN